MHPILLSTAYLPPLIYLGLINSTGPVYIEACEHFQKQSYRNRCHILSANGALPLVIPIQKAHGEKMHIRDARPDPAIPWQKLHWISIRSAYGKAPYFEDYAWMFEPFYHQKANFLLDFNQCLLESLLKAFSLTPKLQFSETYLGENQFPGQDFRQSLHPKKPLPQELNQIPTPVYYQVFSDRFGWVPNLSSIDLLFNEGPNSPAFFPSPK